MQHILVIDNSRDILDLFRDILEAEGYEVSLADSVPKNMTDLESSHPDLIILDFRIGKYQETWQFLRNMAISHATASIPLILCPTDLQAFYGQENYLEYKNIQVVCKPFDIDELIQTVQQAISPPIASYGP